MGFVDLLKERAKKSIKTIVLPETEDMRTIEATDKILKEGVAKIILIGNEEEINKKAAEGGFDISGATIIDPETSYKTQAYIDKFVELRAKKGMTPEKAKEILHTQYPYYGVMMVKMGDADGMVSGACHSTADTLRPCLQILKTKPGTKLVSAFFLIVVPDCEYGANGAFVFADSGLNQNPTPEELSAIAASSAESFQLLVEEEPIVAMLSHSTKGSAKHADVDKMVEATRIAKEEHPELKLDGEFQLDAAIVPEFPNREASIRQIEALSHVNQAKMETGVSNVYFTKRGLADFAAKGLIKEIPDRFYRPLTVKERIRLLKRILPCCRNGNYRLLKKPLNQLSDNLHLCVNSTFGYLLFNNIHNRTICLVINESSILTTFMDYLSSLDDNGLYNAEETAEFVQALIDELMT